MEQARSKIYLFALFDGPVCTIHKGVSFPFEGLQVADETRGTVSSDTLNASVLVSDRRCAADGREDAADSGLPYSGGRSPVGIYPTSRDRTPLVFWQAPTRRGFEAHNQSSQYTEWIQKYQRLPNDRLR
jgi:hypothetical protein